jgi:hypothetical protein
VAFNIDGDHYMELSSKPFLELEEKLELKKYNLAAHYGIDPNEITHEFIKTFDREKPWSVWYNNIKALPSDMKLHGGIMDWHSKSVWAIMNTLDLKHQSPNLIMCLLAMDSLNGIMPPKLLNDASEAEIKGANTALKNALNGEVQPGNDNAINNMP